MITFAWLGLGHDLATAVSPSFRIKRSLLFHRAAAAVDQRLDPAGYHFIHPSPNLLLKAGVQRINRPQGAGAGLREAGHCLARSLAVSARLSDNALSDCANKSL